MASAQTPDPEPDHSLLTSRQLKAMSHPVRRRIVDLLSGGGTARAADLAGMLDLPANQLSFHLRTLAAAELLEEAPELARDRRDRVWRLRGGVLRLADPASPASGADLAAVSAYVSEEFGRVQDLLHRVARFTDAYASGQDQEAKGEWARYTVRLTQEEALAALGEVMSRLTELQRQHPPAGTGADDTERHVWDFTLIAARDDA